MFSLFVNYMEGKKFWLINLKTGATYCWKSSSGCWQRTDRSAWIVKFTSVLVGNNFRNKPQPKSYRCW